MKKDNRNDMKKFTIHPFSLEKIKEIINSEKPDLKMGVIYLYDIQGGRTSEAKYLWNCGRLVISEKGNIDVWAYVDSVEQGVNFWLNEPEEWTAKSIKGSPVDYRDRWAYTLLHD